MIGLRNFIIVLIMSGSPLVNADVVVVGNISSPFVPLTSSQVKDLYLGAVMALPDGTHVKIVNLPDGNPVQEQFYQKVAGMTPSQVKSHWSKRIFSGESPPPMVIDDKAVKRWLALHPGGIGYIDESSLDDSVNVLLKP